MPNENPYAPPNSEISVSEPAGLASRGSRLGGAMIDGIIIMSITAPVMYALGYWERLMAGQPRVSDAISIGVIGFVAFLVLNAYLLTKHGQTLGKRMVKTRIVSAQGGELVPLWKLLSFRYLPQWIAGQIPIFAQIFGIVDPLFVFRGDRRCIHDLLAGTLVIRAESSANDP